MINLLFTHYSIFLISLLNARAPIHILLPVKTLFKFFAVTSTDVFK